MDRTTRRTSTHDATTRVSVTVASPAKINLILRILDRRPDGYHNLWSLMQTVGLSDTVTISLDPASADIRLSCTHPDVPLGAANLIHRAAVAVRERARVSIGLSIALDKRIPMGAGLGGGSSNAAATVIGLNRLLGLGWSAAEMADVAQDLGSDVPFFLYAPTGIVAGRGERVLPLRVVGERSILLVNPGFGVETAWAYKTLAASRTQPPTLPDSLQRLDATASFGWDDLRPLMGNDFEAVVFPQHPVLAAIKRGLLEAGAECAFLSGTGATVFGVFGSGEGAVLAQRSMPREPSWKTWIVSPQTSGLSAEAAGDSR